MGVLAQEVAQQFHADPLAHLAQHPADGFVHQVVRVMQVHFGVAQTPRSLALLQGLPGAHHADALAPEVVAARLRIQNAALVAQTGRQQQPVADNFGRGDIDQIPVVGTLGVAQVQRQDFVAPRDGGILLDAARAALLLELRHQQQQAAQPHFMPGRVQERDNFVQRRAFRLFCHRPRLPHLDAQKLVAMAVLPRRGLEKTHQHLPLRLVLQRAQMRNDFPCRTHQVLTPA